MDSQQEFKNRLDFLLLVIYYLEILLICYLTIFIKGRKDSLTIFRGSDETSFSFR